jgi:hypothetical protein
MRTRYAEAEHDQQSDEKRATRQPPSHIRPPKLIPHQPLRTKYSVFYNRMSQYRRSSAYGIERVLSVVKLTLKNPDLSRPLLSPPPPRPSPRIPNRRRLSATAALPMPHVAR